MQEKDVQGYLKWREGIQSRVALIATKQDRIATLYTALSTAINGQDLPEVYSNGTDVNEFIKHAKNFAEEVDNDYRKMQPYKDEIKKLEREIALLNGIDTKFAKRYGVNLVDTREEMASPEMASARQALRNTVQGQGDMANAHVLNLAAIQDKSAEMLKGWDQVKKNAKTADTIGAVMAVIDIITATGISGNALFRTMHDEGPLMLRETTLKNMMTTIGLRGGQMVDYVTAWTNTSKFLDGLNKHKLNNEGDAYKYISNKVKELTGKNSNFQKLVDRITDHVNHWNWWEKHKKPDPNPWVPQ